MSQYGYRLNVHGNDHAALVKALELYAEKCRSEIAVGNKAPYECDLLKMENMLKDIDVNNEEAWGEFLRPKKRT